MHTAGIPISRIVLVGQSLGTGVVAGVADSYTQDHPGSFAGLVLVAGFSDLATLLLTYSIGGWLPILGPLKSYPRLQNWFSRQTAETWKTSDSVARLVFRAKKLNLTIIHAKNDFDISWSHSDTLFYAAVNGTSNNPSFGMSKEVVDNLKSYEDRGSEGYVNSWIAAGKDGQGTRRIRQEIVHYGGSCLLCHMLVPTDASAGHNRIVTYPIVARAVSRMFGDVHGAQSQDNSSLS